MNFNIIDWIISILVAWVIISLAMDVIKWTFTGEIGQSASGFADKMSDVIMNLPLKLLAAVFNMVLKLVESAVKLVITLLGGKSIAESIDFGQITV